MSLSWMELHRKCGHQNVHRLSEWVKQNSWVKMTGKAADIKNCRTCNNRTQVRLSFPGDHTRTCTQASSPVLPECSLADLINQ